MKDNEINRAKCGCALEPSHLNIQACVSSLHSRDFRTQLAPIKRYDTGERAVTPLGCCLPPAPCTGLRQESCISMEHSPPGHLQYGPTHLILLCSSCRALCTSKAQKLCSFRVCLVQQAEQQLKAQMVSESPVTICPQQSCHRCCSPSHSVTALMLLFAPLSKPPQATMLGNIYLYINLSLTQKWESCSSPPLSYCHKDLVRLFLLSMLGKVQVSTPPCWFLPVHSAWFTKSAVIVGLAAYSIFALC